MAIESMYWREELKRIKGNLEPARRPKRFSERLLCSAERDTMIGFFIVRRLIELNKVSSMAADLSLAIYYNTPLKDINRLNRYSVEENYVWDLEKSGAVSLSYISNQFIHAYMSLLFRDNSRNWSDFLIFSDYERNQNIWRVPVPEIVRAFDFVISDWPSKTRWSYNDKKRDYDVQSLRRAGA